VCSISDSLVQQVVSEPPLKMSDLQLIGGVKKLNNQNYKTWATYLSSYLQGQDLWDVVQGNDTVQPARETNDGALRKWRVKAGKAMFILKTTVEEDLLEHIKDATNPKMAWDTLAESYPKRMMQGSNFWRMS
jgi:hypothetical protein